MRLSSKIIALFVFMLFASTFFSQSAGQALEAGQDVNVLFRNESTGNISLHSRGFSGNYRRLWHVTGTRKRLIEFELLNMRHPKELKKKQAHGKSYYFGKLNGLTFFRAGYGYQQTLYRRAERKSIEVRMVYTVGPTICFAKPVFLEIEYPDTIGSSTGTENMITKVEAYDPAKHNPNNILGRAPLFYGLDKTTVFPGAHAKLGFSFEYGETRASIKALETGVIVDYFPKAIQTMAYVQPENFFVTLYVGFTFGKRWF
jgi:hypothetical protein